jgi:hypothetical protein
MDPREQIQGPGAGTAEMSNVKHGNYASGADKAFARRKCREYQRRHKEWRKAYNHAYYRNLPTPKVGDFK